ncbi:MAG: methyltransferase domain-containing protein, partial [Planctomycetes bacterium]|nr:methyltransferase domain-containing protein [Planctomycetota bacterium]
TWRYAWPAGVRLSAELPELADCRDRRVADLGCGQGHNGLMALLGGAASVLFADAAPSALQWVRQVIDANDLAARAQAVEHRWGDPLPGVPCDLILGGDILYRPECFAGLLDTIATSLAADGQALLSDPRRSLDEPLPELAAVRGLAWNEERRAGWTLVRVGRS